MDIQKKFDDSLRSNVLSDALVDMTESSIDSLIDNELLKQIPIVKSFIGITQTGINIHDKLFLKKIISFLVGIDEIDSQEREKIIKSIDSSKKYRLRVGEKLLYVIDSCDDYEGSERVAKLFRAVLTKDITYEEYLEASSVLVRLSNIELKAFLDAYNIGYMSDAAKELTHTGLVFSETEEVQVEVEKVEPQDYDDPPEHYKTDVSGGDVTILPTAAGDTIYEVFGMGRKARQKQINEEREKRRQELSKRTK